MGLKLGYWKIRGLVAGCEMLCEFVEQEYETTKYEVMKKADGGWDRSSWFDVKFSLGFIRVCYMGADRAEWMNGGAAKCLDLFEMILSEHAWFINNDSPTYIDFFAWEIIDHHCCMKPNFLDNHAHVKNWHKKFADLPAVVKYHSDSSYTQYPINNKMAVWGGQEKNDGTFL